MMARTISVAVFAVLLLSCPAWAAPAHYLVLGSEAGGPWSLKFHRIVRLAAPPASLPEIEIARQAAQLGRLADAHTVELVEALTGHVVHRGLAPAPKWIRSERPQPDGTIAGEVFEAPERFLVVRVPVIEGTVLRIRGDRTTQVVELPLLPSAASVSAITDPSCEAIEGNLSLAGNRLDVLILGDGFTAAERDTFAAHARKVADELLTIHPYDVYRHYVGFHILHTDSPESGIDHPPQKNPCVPTNLLSPECCPSYNGPEKFVETAFDGTFCALYSPRTIATNPLKVLARASECPDWDQILIILNDPEFAGTAIPWAALGTASDSMVWVFQHEFAHSFTLLADEYEDRSLVWPPCSDVDPEVTACEANVTDETARDRLKWGYWLHPETPVPTQTQAADGRLGAGLWRGARYDSTRMHRQGYSCAMRNAFERFCTVDSEQYPLRLYGGGWGGPLDGISGIERQSQRPATALVFTANGSPQAFSARVLGPTSPDPLVNWYVNGSLVRSRPEPTGSEATLVVTSSTPGLFEVTLEVVDRTPILHDLNREIATSRHVWEWLTLD